MIENLYGERLFVVNLVKLLEVGTPAISGEVLGLVYGRKLGNNGLSFSTMRPSP